MRQRWRMRRRSRRHRLCSSAVSDTNGQQPHEDIRVCHMGSGTHQSHEDQLETTTKWDSGQHRNPERDPLPARPPKPEQADNEQGPTNTRQRDASILFFLRPRPALSLSLLQVRIPREEHRQRAQRTSTDREEAQPLDAGREPIHLLEDDRVRLERHVEDAVAQREVDARGGDDELEEEHPHRPGEHAHGELVQVRRLELVGGDDVGLGVEPADALRPLDEEDRAVRLGQEEQEDHGQPRVDEADPEGPSPADRRGAEAGYDGGEERAEDGGLVAALTIVSGGRVGSGIMIWSPKEWNLLRSRTPWLVLACDTRRRHLP